MDVGGVGAAVDVAVGLQAVLRGPHHVGGFHRRPAEEGFSPDRELGNLCSHAQEVAAWATALFFFFFSFKSATRVM